MLNVPMDIVKRTARVASTLRNVVEVARFGGLETGEQPSPFEVVAHKTIYRLRRYFPNEPSRGGPPILLVPPLMVTAEVWDVSPATSAVRRLCEAGIDPWVIDFGSPEHEVGGLKRTLAEHVVAISEAVDIIRERNSRDVHLSGYSQGGLFCYQVAAFRRCEGVASLITFGSPVDPRQAMPFGIPEEIGVRGASALVGAVNGRGVPGWAIALGFRMLDPVKSVRQQVDFLRQLHDRDALLPHERQRQFLAGAGFVAWPGPALADFVQQFLVHNRMLQGGLVIDGRLSTVADVTCPILYFIGATDDIAPAASVRPIRSAAPRAEVYEASVPSGHYGLVVGRRAAERSWPLVISWIHWLAGMGDLPASVTRIDPGDDHLPETQEPNVALNALGQAVGVAGDAALLVAGSAVRTVRTAGRFTEEAMTQMPRLTRLGRTRPGTRLSLALLLREQASRAPDDVSLLYRDRGYTNAEIDEAVEGVTRALLTAGVRQGEQVGVLMGSRPSAVAVVAALNRLGAVAVLLRPDGDIAREADLGATSRVVADPERAEAAEAAGATGDTGTLHTFHLDENAMPSGSLALPPGEGFQLPGWYAADSGRAGDLAFILFTGRGTATRANHVTNGRWALSALGTASSASLGREDTLLSINPLHHPSGLLTSVGGAFAAGARLAIATSLDPDSFWDESHRYGATVISYTWAQLRSLLDEADGAPTSGRTTFGREIRLFLGSGMPPGLWARVLDRFSTAGVLEFWVTAGGDAVLANVSGVKRGALGRPLPGSAEVRLARYDIRTRSLLENANGFLLPCKANETGMLLVRTDSGPAGPGLDTRGAYTRGAIRGAFARGDAWIATDSLFRRDDDGDYWLVDTVSGLIPTAAGVVASLPVTNALSIAEGVDLAVTYGLVRTGADQIAVAAVSLRPHRKLTAPQVTRALAGLDVDQRPTVVQVVDEIPLTTWGRPYPGELPTAGVPVHAASRPVWHRDAESGDYRTLTAAARQRLLGTAKGVVGAAPSG